jgi:hypothetical protein
MNNTGMINIGSLLTRLGIQIFSGSAQNAGVDVSGTIKIRLNQELKKIRFD